MDVSEEKKRAEASLSGAAGADYTAGSSAAEDAGAGVVTDGESSEGGAELSVENLINVVSSNLLRTGPSRKMLGGEEWRSEFGCTWDVGSVPTR